MITTLIFDLNWHQLTEFNFCHIKRFIVNKQYNQNGLKKNTNPYFNFNQDDRNFFSFKQNNAYQYNSQNRNVRVLYVEIIIKIKFLKELNEHELSGNDRNKIYDKNKNEKSKNYDRDSRHKIYEKEFRKRSRQKNRKNKKKKNFKS